jgi:SAM-dependent methyltransferase
MELATYEEMYRLEDHHWWFVGKRLFVHALVRDLLARPHLRVLDLGCGTGGLLAHLQADAAASRLVVGADRSQEALRFCGRRGLRSVACAETTRLPFRASTFDLVLLLDVLEHVHDEAALLGEIRAVLRPGATLLVSVPAYQFLWSAHDEALHHVRRYTAPRLRRALDAARFEIVRLTYTNAAALPPAVIVRGVLPRLGLRRADGTDLRPQAAWVNRLLTGVYAAEAALVQHVRLPFGLSVVAVARRPADT